ncbi:MAG TPA: bifunctional RNase H/acid phosphatase [Dermatophilaceae bacterium]|nr:bifunctional RNase H/acid phosphatase [Dermatophilaceae bacterium]
MGRRLTVEADGGSRGNPGVAGYGALVRDTASGALLVERAEPLGTASNNVAEYRGLLAGLEAARAIEPAADVEARLDSKLVVEQMSGRWKVKHEDMRRLALQCRRVVDDITAAGGSVRFTWIPRAENTAADALSNVAMDGRTVDRTFGGEPAVEQVPPGRQPPLRGTVGASGERDALRGPPRGTPTRVLLVRHGVTDFTAAGRLDGRGGADPPLSEAGRAQAEAAGRAVAHLVAGHPARVVSSALTRARETAAAVSTALGVAPEADPDWDEQGFGDWDGVSVQDLVRDARADFARLRDDPAYARPGGESHEQMAHRVLLAFERAVEAGGTTVVVCHRKPIMVVLAHLLGMSHDKAWRLAASPGSLHAVEVWETGEVSVAFTNRT